MLEASAASAGLGSAAVRASGMVVSSLGGSSTVTPAMGASWVGATIPTSWTGRGLLGPRPIGAPSVDACFSDMSMAEISSSDASSGATPTDLCLPTIAISAIGALALGS